MGPSQSKTKSVTDIANEFVSTSVIKATTRNATTTAGSQKIKIECTDDVAKNASNLCSSEKLEMSKIIMMDATTPMTERIAAMKAYKPEVCDTCLISDITQDLGITITIDDIQNNTVATEIQTQIMADLEKKLKNANTGTIAGKTQVDAITKVKNLVVNNFNVDVVNETLKNFDFDQNIDLKNVKVSNISQKMLVKSISSNLIANSMKNNAELQNAVKDLVDADNKAAGVAQGLADTAGDVLEKGIDAAGETAGKALETAEKSLDRTLDSVDTNVNRTLDSVDTNVDRSLDTVDSITNYMTFIIIAIIVVTACLAIYAIKKKLYCVVPFLAPMCAVQKAVE